MTMKILKSKFLIAGAALSLFAAVAHANTVDLTGSASAAGWTSSGAYVSNVDPSGSQGTGVFEPFMREQGSGQTSGGEEGVNTSGTPFFDTKGGVWTHEVLFTDMDFFSCADLSLGAPCDATATYFLFVLDYNQNASAGGILLSLDNLKIYDSTTGNVNSSTYDDGSLLFDLSGDLVLLDYSVSSTGSGGGDFYMYIPLDLTSVDPYMVFYAEMGATGIGDYDSRDFSWNDGFEEWAFVVGPGCQGETNCDGGNTNVPEPSSMLLMGGGLLGLAFWRKRKSA